MCNFIHENHHKIQEAQKSGVGYKLFSHNGGQLASTLDKMYIIDDDEYIRWKHEKDDFVGDGFCFFFDKEEALRALKDWRASSPLDQHFRGAQMKKIYYNDAFCRQIERLFIHNKSYEIGLCKEFRILEGDE